MKPEKDRAQTEKSLKELCLKDFSLKERTAFGVGGRAKYACFPESAEELIAVLRAAEREDIPVAVLGCASNVIVSDRGFDGAAVFTAKLNGLSCSGDTVTAFSGVALPRFLDFCRLHDLSGAEFLYGIPASVGGLVAMNAGAFGKEIGSIIQSVTAYSCGSVKALAPEDCGFAYRSSSFGGDNVVISAEFSLHKGFDARFTEKIRKIRKEKQPRGRTFGSTFKNGKDYFAGELIERAGLKNFSVGGAAVSEKHANFIVNKGGATADDVRRLIAYIKEKVNGLFGVDLAEEVRYLGDFE